MRYSRFIVKNYRAIRGPLEISVAKSSLIPIIGVNECGKTTILHALLSFDSFMDDFGRQLADVQNLYDSSPPDPEVSAEVEISADNLKLILAEKEIIDSIVRCLAPKNEPEEQEDDADEESANDDNPEAQQLELKHRHDVTAPAVEELTKWLLYSCRARLTITRVLKKPPVYKPQFPNTYPPPSWCDDTFWNVFLTRIIAHLPYLLYFDEFKHQIDERIEIVDKEKSEWLQILNVLFKSVNAGCSVTDLRGREERQRKSILAKVNKALNQTLTSEWQNFRLDNTDALEVNIDYEEEGAAQNKRCYLRFEVVETDANKDKHFFFIRDRSKGFYWFFNFVMRLEFNPKTVAGSELGAVYLLDEPGSYLHASAQEKLCKKLRQISKDNAVIYCTHSHHLLNPDVIPVNTIMVAEKEPQGDVTLVPIYSHRGEITDRRSAFQPVYDALKLRPMGFDFGSDNCVVLTEGIIDYYALEIFKADNTLRILPGVGADSILFYISLMIAWQIPFRVLWDNDEKGRVCLERATEHFGPTIAERQFVLLPLEGNRRRKAVLENLFKGNDLQLIRQELGVPENCSFEKTITGLFYSDKRNVIAKLLSAETKRAFENVFHTLNVDELRPNEKDRDSS